MLIPLTPWTVIAGLALILGFALEIIALIKGKEKREEREEDSGGATIRIKWVADNYFTAAATLVFLIGLAKFLLIVWGFR